MRKLTQAGWARLRASLKAIGRNFPKLMRESHRHAGKCDLGAMAGSLAFTTVLSIAPLMAVLFYVFKLFGGLEYGYAKLEPFLLENLSEGTGDVVAQHLNNFIHQVHAKAVGWAGIAGLLTTAVMTYFTVMKSFNHIWEVQKPKGIHHRILRAVTLITIGPVLVVISIAVTTAISTQIAKLPFSGHLVAVLLNMLLYSSVYSLVPSVRLPVRTIVIGSFFPALLWELAKSGYAIYTSKVVTYSKFYGSLAAIPLFLLWIYIAWYITLFGAVWIRSLHLRREELKLK